MFHYKININNKYTLDLNLTLLLTFISVIFICVPILNETSLRIVYSSLLMFFIPGYAFIASIFPKKDEISGIERFTLSIGFSIIIVTFTGLVVSLTKWMLNQYTIALSLLIFTVIFIFIASIRRNSLDEEERFTLFITEKNKIADTKSVDENESIGKKPKKFMIVRKTKVKTIKKRNIYNIINQNDRPNMQKILFIGLLCSLVLVSGFIINQNITREKDSFTTLYVLGPNGKAEEYPHTISESDPAKIIVGIENHELTHINYILQAKLDGMVLEEIKVNLGHKEKWEQELIITPTRLKLGRQKLEFALYKDQVGNFAYRSVHIWVTQDLSEEIIDTLPSNTNFIQMQNADMESDDGWTFLSGNETTVTGSYVNGTGVYSSRAFVINSTFEGNRGQPGFELHYIEQEIHSDRKEDVVLSVYLKDSYKQGTSGKDESQFKRVTLNDLIVWSDGINGDKGWQRLQVPVTLQEGKNTLVFALAQNRNMDTVAVELAIDKVSFIPLSAMSPYLREDNTVEAVPPVSWVDPLPVNVGQNKFTVTWNGTDEGSGIYYYDIDYSTDGVSWKRWISKTTTTSAEFEGIEGQTYYFRSKAVDNALNEEMLHRIADTSTTIDSKTAQLELDITPNPTSDITYLTLTSSKPLMEVECLVVPQTFGSSEYVKLTTTDNIKWTAKYTIKLQDTYNVEITAKDFANNTAYTFGTIYTDTSLEELTIDISPEKTSTDVEIRVTASTALRDEPSVVVRDRSGNRLDVSYEKLDGNKYIYMATVDDDINDGVARVTATAKTVDSQSLYEEETFIIDRIDPKVNTFSPDNGETVNINNPSIRATFSDDRAGIERSRITLRVNGEDVTNAADITSSSLYYSTSNLDDGEVEVRLSVTDQAGNTFVKTWSFYVATS
ncbi:DUF1616 domain-containing protein [Methanolobus sp. WCC5]|uniref:DUF1616 domain-containing protein n=1 Tax=Methanolobus sp. WCC5 TaxID=3125785 RepID=UPI00324DAFE8